MEAVLEDIAFLANSTNRVAVCRLLAEDPKTRDDLIAHLDASRITITRILRELHDRGWITPTGNEYTMTARGTWVLDAFTDLADEIAAEQRLRQPLQWLPPDVLTFDIRCLRDAELIRVDESDPTAIIRRIVEFHQSGDRIRGLARGAAPVLIENQWELTIHGTTHLELVLTPAALDPIRTHPPSRRRLADMLDAPNAQYYTHEDIPLSVGIVNGAVGINLTDNDGVLKGGLITDHATVHEWAVDLFERYRDHAQPIDPDTLDR